MIGAAGEECERVDTPLLHEEELGLLGDRPQNFGACTFFLQSTV